jgi:hypothetical protein
MNSTPFPTRPMDVVALTVQEFTRDLTLDVAPSLAAVCTRFADDANRALVWLIRFRALQTVCARGEMAEWLDAGSDASKDICELAASFKLNDRWEFDARDFRSAIQNVVSRKLRTDRPLGHRLL